MKIPRIFLEPVEFADNRVVFIPQGNFTAVYCWEQPAQTGSDYICGVCRSGVLAGNIHEGQIWSVVFKCYLCGGLSASPRLPPGTPIPETAMRWGARECHFGCPQKITMNHPPFIGDLDLAALPEVLDQTSDFVS